MKDFINVIVFYLTFPIWVVTFFIYYGIYIGKELAQRLIKATMDSDEQI